MESSMGPITPTLSFYPPSLSSSSSSPSMATIPRFRVMDQTGAVIPGASEPQVGKEQCVKMYEDMVTLNVMDNYLYDVQRQGRISFYMTNYGEEAAHIGSAAALDSQDTVFAQYREAGVLLYRGFTIQEFTDQCYSNKDDRGKGRQMPVHYGAKHLYFQTISSPLSTQIPQAAGYAYGLKYSRPQNCVVCYFGDGAASEGDFHAGVNAASTLSCPVIFFCRNNQYAISTPVEEQFRGDGIASRGPGYGVDTIRVDGNDIWAVYLATQYARKKAVEEKRPVLLEAMSYRIGHHSTSDDSTRYRSTEEIEFWRDENDPIARFRKYLEKKGWWDAEKEATHRKAMSKAVIESIKRSEMKKKPKIAHLFGDVYDVPTPAIIEQEREMADFLAKYGKHYKLDTYDS